MVRTRVQRGVVIGMVLFVGSCGGDRVPTSPPSPSPLPITPTLPSPTPTPTATPDPSPSANAACGNLAPGPVTRLTVSPREHSIEGVKKTMKVLVRKEFTDEVLCVDMDLAHRIDFNLNQRNDDNKECCWTNGPSWSVGDPNGMVVGEGVRDDHGFIYRVQIDPRGRRGRIAVDAYLDGVDSYPWESRSEYSLGPVIVEAMPKDELYLCNCTYIGNGGYMGPDCPKSNYGEGN
jgi:hypothetical protein